MQGVWKADLPSDPPYGSNLAHKIADFVFLAFIFRFVALEFLNVLGSNRKHYIGSVESWSDLPPTPPSTL